jgi:beta-lactamase class C
MRLIILLLTLLSSLVFPFPTAYPSSPEQSLASDYELFFREQIKQDNILGAAFVVVSGEQIIHLIAAGHTDIRRTQRIDRNTAFRVASISKTFAAGLTGILIAEGQFSWDDPVNRYVPGFRINGDSRQVRIRHLLGQSTGLMPHAYDNLIEDGVPVDKIRDQYRKLSYICSPGQCYSYQNSIFSLIEPVIEEVTSSSYSLLMEEKIFQPLNMKTASIGYESFVNNPNHAKPHVLIKKGNWKTINVKPNYYRFAPAAGVNASALDMGKWLMAQLGSHPEVIQPEVVDTLTRPRVKTRKEKYRRHWKNMLTDAHYGLGWRIYQLGEHQLAYHSGTNSINKLTATFWEMAFATLNKSEIISTGKTPDSPAP